jgi:hypothetical protein
MSTVIARPGKKFMSGNSNPYIKVNVGGGVKNVMLDTDTLGDWDNIKTIEVDMVDYDHSTAPDGTLTGPGFSRAEIVDYQTFGREVAVKSHEIKLEVMSRKLLKETVLDAAEVAELEEAI